MVLQSGLVLNKILPSPQKSYPPLGFLMWAIQLPRAKVEDEGSPACGRA